MITFKCIMQIKNGEKCVNSDDEIMKTFNNTVPYDEFMKKM